ncbi:MAG: MarR family transcriptional regulator [Desulfobacula sp.]|nr:MarR family transcriptional regulator [Desulfobacula sp.]
MSKKKEMFAEIFDRQLTILVNKWNILEKKPRDYGTGDLLFPSEIHAISAVTEHPDAHMSEIAQKLGVTRGAVMQLVVKLEKRNLVERYRKEDSNKKVFIRLTSKGKIAFAGHKKYHRKMYDDLYPFLKNLKSEQLNLFKQVFGIIETHIDEYLEEKE